MNDRDTHPADEPNFELPEDDAMRAAAGVVHGVILSLAMFAVAALVAALVLL